MNKECKRENLPRRWNWEYGVWNSRSYGPAFGYGNFGHDLCICDRADKNKASYAEFPLSFNN